MLDHLSRASGLKGVEALDIGLGNHKEVLDHCEVVVEPMSALEETKTWRGSQTRLCEREGEPMKLKAGGHSQTIYC